MSTMISSILKDAMLLTNTTALELAHRSGISEHLLIDYLYAHCEPNLSELNWLLSFMGKAVQYQLQDADDPFRTGPEQRRQHEQISHQCNQHTNALSDDLRGSIQQKQQHMPF
jgi:transcriptional regulator with XRE-family HTH domain